ncbi:MAG: pyridoxamine 5'-phosphate oxidase [Alphaproteobacteria bacterium 13_2_20CM_2_64_7]|nr:MAG: pyridoxamine 5'-phosphate oxidase [Alphaproteobacteria bacterium 13_2_20CM_2_64_7]
MSESVPIQQPGGLPSGDFTEAEEPLRLFAAWFEEASRSEPRDPTAMSLATVDADGLPNVRMVLMKSFGEAGFVFYTNVESQKGRELDREHKGALLFHWKSLNRQVRLRGPVERIEDAEADAYFATRPRLTQIGTWASKQSAPLESRHAFEKAIAFYTAKFALGTIPRPPNWTGYRLRPLLIEFWKERPFRLHDRLEFHRETLDAPWRKTRLYP